MRDEQVNEMLFRSFDHAREAVARWAADYTHRRPHPALGQETPSTQSVDPSPARSPQRAIRCVR